MTVSAGSGGFGPVRQGAGATTTLTQTMPTRSRARCRASNTCRPGPTRAAGRSPNRRTGTRRFRAPARICRRSAPGRCSSAASSPRRMCARAAKVAVLGSVARDQLFGAGRRSHRRDDPDQEPAVPRARRPHEQGTGGDGTRSGRHVIVPYTTVQKKLLGITHLQNITLVGRRRRAVRRRCPRQLTSTAARASSHRAPGATTTSPSARRRRWPRC